MGCVGRRCVWVWEDGNLKKLQVGGKAGKVAKTGRRGRRGKNVALSSRDIELMRDMFEFGFWSAEALAKKFEVPLSHVVSVLAYKTNPMG